jgi:hypothetical protein
VAGVRVRVEEVAVDEVAPGRAGSRAEKSSNKVTAREFQAMMS